MGNWPKIPCKVNVMQFKSFIASKLRVTESHMFQVTLFQAKNRDFFDLEPL